MCGLVGVAGDLRHVDVQVFKQMLLMDSVRGMHSTGVAAVGSDVDDTVVIKHAVNGALFVENFWHKNLDLLTNRALIGHNRHATRGKICLRNAHPFISENGKIVGAHNGTLDTGAIPKLPGVDGNSYGTDSEALINSIAETNPSEALTTAYGAWALSWYDFEKETINFHRNSDENPVHTRPLWFCFSEDGKRVYWSSELGILMTCLGRNSVDHAKAHPLRPDRHVSLKVDPRKAFEEPKIVTLESGKPPFSGRGGGGSTTTTTTSSRGTSHNHTRQPSPPPTLNQSPGFVSLAERMAQQRASKTRVMTPPQADDTADTAEGLELCGAIGPDGKALSRNQAKKILRNAPGGDSHGAPCASCGVNVRKDDNFVALPVGDTILCEDCGTDPALLEDLNQQLGLNLGVA